MTGQVWEATACHCTDHRFTKATNTHSWWLSRCSYSATWDVSRWAVQRSYSKQFLQGGRRGNFSVQLLPIFSLPASPHREFLPQIPSQVTQLPQWLLKKPIPVMQWPAATKPGYGWGARDPRGTAGQPQVAKLDRPTQNQSVSLAAEGLESRWGLENLMKYIRLYYTTGVGIKIISKAQKYILLLQLLPNISLCFEPGLCP